MYVFIWAILVVVFVIIEIATVQLVSIWLAAGALVTMFAAYFTDIGFIGQLILFLVTSVILFLLSFPIVRKRMKKQGHTATNSDLDVGKTARVIEEISNDKGTGRVTLNGVDWGAVSENGDTIPAGTIVVVTKVLGSRLEVKPE